MKVRKSYFIFTFFKTILALLISFPLFFFQTPLNSQSGKPYKKIYFETLDSVSTARPEVITKIRNQVSLNILRYFKSKYSFIDDSVVNGLMAQLKKQQSLGCETDKCFQMIEDNLSPDEKITGTLQMNGNKYTLTLKLLDVSRSSAIVEQKEVSFSYSQMEYFMEEITRSLLDSSYMINIDGAPSEFQATKVDLSAFKVKEIEGIDIKILNFQSTDSRAEGIISELKGELQDGDSKFQNKKYESALKSYQDILQIIDKSITQDARSSIKEFIDGIQKRIENTKTNLYGEKLNNIDQKFKNSSSEISIQNIEKFIKEYETLRSTIFANINNSSLLSSIDERIKKLETNLLGSLEREGDAYYDSYQFSESLNSYVNIKEKINKSLKLTSPEKLSLVGKIDKKIKVVQETGTSYYANQIKAYCNLAEKENVKVSIKKIKGESVSYSSIKENIRKAEMILRKNKLIDNETLEYYNSIVKILNKDGDPIAVLISKSEIGNEFSKKESSSTEEDFTLKLPPIQPFLFPGLGHLEQNSTSSRGKFYRNMGFVTLGIIGFSYYNYNEKNTEYKSFNILPFYIISVDMGVLPAMIYSDVSLKEPRSQLETSISYVNGSIGLFSLLYFASLIDYAFTSDFKTSDGWKLKGMEYGNWDLKTERNVIHSLGGVGMDEKVNLQYKMRW